MKIVEEYKRSLKLPEAEEVVDLFFYRPLGFIIVKIIYKLPITPNQISFLSMFIGLIAAWQISIGNSYAMMMGGELYLISNILDCTDGQLARLQDSGTLLGRVIDGIVDYIVGVAVFVSIGLNVKGYDMWLFVLLAGISTAIHAIFFDHYQNEFISKIRNGNSFLEEEINQFMREIARIKTQGDHFIKRIFLTLYLTYLFLQKRFDSKSMDSISINHTRQESVMIRIWSFLGPSTNRTLLIISLFIGRIDYYLWFLLIVGNLWLILSYTMQRMFYRSIERA